MNPAPRGLFYNFVVAAIADYFTWFVRGLGIGTGLLVMWWLR